MALNAAAVIPHTPFPRVRNTVIACQGGVPRLGGKGGSTLEALPTLVFSSSAPRKLYFIFDQYSSVFCGLGEPNGTGFLHAL